MAGKMSKNNTPEILIVGQAVSSSRNLHKINSEFTVEKVSNNIFRDNAVFYIRKYRIIWIHVDSVLAEHLAQEFTPEHVLATTSTGFTHIPEKIVRKLGEKFISLKGQTDLLETITSTAELAWAMTLAGLTGLIEAHEDVKRGSWRRLVNSRQFQVSSSHIGVIGYGRLGKMYAKFAKQMAKAIFVWDISDERREEARGDGYVVTESLVSLVQRVNALSLHVNVESNAVPLIDSALVSHFQDGMIVVNTSRGIVVDEAAILTGLESGKIKKYFSDVLAVEDSDSPITESEIWKAGQRTSQIILTPHIGGASKDAIEQCELNILSQIRNSIYS